jgi:hypothetical protein
MKNFLVLITFVFAMAIVSCKKSSNSTGYSFSADFDGKPKSFNTSVIAIKSKLADSIYSLNIAGITSAEQSGLLLWSNQDDFVAGKTFAVSALNGTTENELTYVSPMGSSDPTSQWTTTYDLGVQPEDLHCTITEITSTYVKGTFSGTIYENSNTVTSKVVTNGQFYAKF